VAANVHLARQEGDFLSQFFIVSEVIWCGRESEIGHGGNLSDTVYIYSILYY